MDSKCDCYMWTATGSVVPSKDWQKQIANPQPSVPIPDVNVAQTIFDKPEDAAYKKQVGKEYVAMYLADGSFRKVPRYLPRGT